MLTCLQHRDLKLDNILTNETKDGADVQLVDFGLSAHFEELKLEHDVVGTWVRYSSIYRCVTTMYWHFQALKLEHDIVLYLGEVYIVVLSIFLHFQLL